MKEEKHNKFLVNKVLQKANKDAGKYINAAYIFYLLCWLAYVFAAFYFNKSEKTWVFYAHFIIPLLTLFTFYALSNWIKWRDYRLLRKLILLEITEDPYHTLHYLLFVSLRVLFSILFYLSLCISPLFFDLKGVFGSEGAIAPLWGSYLVLIILSLLMAYGFILLPTTIGFKTQQIQKKYFYWLYFLKSQLLNGPVSLFLGLPLLLILAVIIILLPAFLSEYRGKQMFEHINHLALMLAVLGIAISVSSLIINELLKKKPLCLRSTGKMRTA